MTSFRYESLRVEQNDVVRIGWVFVQDLERIGGVEARTAVRDDRVIADYGMKRLPQFGAGLALGGNVVVALSYRSICEHQNRQQERWAMEHGRFLTQPASH